MMTSKGTERAPYSKGHKYVPMKLRSVNRTVMFLCITSEQSPEPIALAGTKTHVQ
jgi:hypothetical protein